MYQYDDDDDGERSPRRMVVAGLGAVLALLALGWFVGRPLLDDDDAPTRSPLEVAGATTAQDVTDTVAASIGGRSESSGPAGTEREGFDSDTTERAATSATGDDDPATTEPSATTEAAETTTAATTTSVTTTTAALTTTTQPGTYASLPDGSPTPVVAIFDVSVITLTGAVPSQAAVDRLSALALANSKTPATINNQLTINPAVPINVGVRVIELTSSRFPEGSAEILPEQAAEFDRVVTVMNALPNVTALVIGHADQRGSEATNFAISEARAQAAVSYLASRGIAPARLSSRAVGEADLLSLNDDAAALALNRRTEFVFYGLLLE